MCLTCHANEHPDTKQTKSNDVDSTTESNEPPEGYYAFVKSPNAEPPKVRPPPYIDSDKECYGTCCAILMTLVLQKK